MLAATVAVVALAASSAVSTDIVYPAPGNGRAVTVLVFHGGGFLYGVPALEEPFARRLQRRGFEVRSVGYPLGDVERALRYARRTAREARRAGRRVYAVGESAGGSIAVHLAERRLVDRAVAVAAPTDFARWNPPRLDPAQRGSIWRRLGLSLRERARLSPRPSPRSAPLRLFHSRADTVVPYRQSLRYVASSGGTATIRRLRGEHLSDRAWERDALRWLARR